MALTTENVYEPDDDDDRAQKENFVAEGNPVKYGRLDERLANQPKIGDDADLAGKSGVVSRVVSHEGGLEVTVRLQDEDSNVPVSAPQTVHPQAYVYEGVTADNDEHEVDEEDAEEDSDFEDDDDEDTDDGVPSEAPVTEQPAAGQPDKEETTADPNPYRYE